MAAGELPLSPEELRAAKAYMRIEGTEEDATVEAMVLAAREYLSNAGVELPPKDSPRRALYDLAAHALALNYYDHRDSYESGTVAENLALRQAINQLKLSEPT